MHMYCSKIGLKVFKQVQGDAYCCTLLSPNFHTLLGQEFVHRSTYRLPYRLKQLRSEQIPTKFQTSLTKFQAKTTKLGTCAQKTRSFHGSWVTGALRLMDSFMRQSLFGSIVDHPRAMAAVQNEPIDQNPTTINLNNPWHMNFDSGSQPFLEFVLKNVWRFANL